MESTEKAILTRITYREKVLASDRDGVREIVASSGFFSADEILVADELVSERLSKGASSGYFFLFAERSQRLIGYSCFGPIPCTRESYDLYWIAVHDELRGAGIGRELLKRVEGIIGKMGGRRVYVETSSRLQYAPTRAFYQKSGYREEARLKDFYSPGDDKLIYLKLV
jgi:ribosomal protein S18 acetylase RimI-like enzyme